MKKTLRKVGGYLAAVWYFALLVVGCIAYFVTKPTEHGFTDGLGRQLSEAPFIMRFVFGQERLWAGWSWFFVDMGIFWGSLALIIFCNDMLQEKEDR